MTCETQHVEDIHNVLSVMQKTLECPICLDLMKEPVATRCDHIFCRFCMLQLLGRKKKGRAQCPMCKTEVTKRSLQESPRFKLLIDGLMKIINAFELDSGYKFFPSQDHAKNILMTCEESKKEEQTVVQSTGYRSRNRKRTIHRGKCEDHTALLETSIDTLLTRDAGTESCNRLKRKKQETNDVKSKRPLITKFESDYSEDDLFKNVGSLGNDCSRSYPQSELGDVDSAERQHEDLKICENISLKPETDEVVASDLAEYGFSERDLESTRSNLLCMDSTRALKETAAKKRSSKVQGGLILDVDLADRKAEQNLLGYLDGNTVHSEHNDQVGSTSQSKKHIHDESHILKITFDHQYDKDDSVPEEMASTQSSPRCMPNAVPRNRLKRSIQRVHEWLQKTSEFLNATPWDEELLSEVFPELDEDVSDKGSCMSGETEIMTAFCPSTVPDAVDKMVNVQDQVFGKVYRREKKSNTVPKITVFASVHVDGVADSRKTNKIPKRSTSGLQPEDFIKRVETTEESYYTNDGDTVAAKDILINTEKNQSNQDSKYLNNDKSNTEETKLKTQNKSLKRKSESSLILVKSSDLGMDTQHSPHFSEINIKTYPSSNESGHEDNQRNVRRSKRLNVLSKSVVPSPNQKPTRTSGRAIKEIEPAYGHPVTETVFQAKQMCTTFNESEDQISNILTHNGKVVPFVTDVEIHPAHPECETSDVSIKECCNMETETVRNVLSAEDIDSDADTQHLMKAFKSAKRMSFKLDSITEMDNKEHFNPVNLSDTKGNLPNQAGIALTVSEKQEQVIHTNDSILSSGSSLGKFNVGGQANQQDGPIQNLPANLRFEKSSVKSTHMPEKESMLSASQLDVSNPVNETALHKESTRKINSVARKSEVLVLCSENDTTTLYPIIAHRCPSVRRADTRSATTRGENEQVKKDCYREQNFHEEQLNQMTSDNGFQGSVTEKLLQYSVSHHSSPLKSPEANSDTPDGILCITDRPGEEHSFCAEAEKSFVFAKEQKVGVSDSPKSPINESQLIKKKKRRAQKLVSSEEESSEDEELPCFNNFLLGNASNSAAQKYASSDFSPKQQGGGVLAMFSSYSTSGKTQTSLIFPRETLLGSQESVNLFSSQSNTSDHSTNVTDQELKHNQSDCHEKNSKRNGDTIYSSGQGQMDHEIADNFYEDTCTEQNLDEVSECESEASHTGDSSGLSSQCDVFNTQQRDALRNNLEKIQEEMAALEAVLEQHNTPSPSSEKEQTSTAELNTIRLQEACQKQTDHGAKKSPDCVPETDVQPLRSVEQPVHFGIGSRSPTPPPSPSQTKSRMETPEKVRSTFLLLKELKESALTQEESNSLEQSAEYSPSTKRPDTCKPPATSLNQATASPRSLRSTTQSNGALNKSSSHRRRDSTKTAVSVKQQSQQQTNIGGIQRSSSPIFTSPIGSRKGSASSKIPVVPNRRNFSIVASGLSQNELMLVQKFARKTHSIFSGEVSESTTHVIIKTDEYLVCERTLKYFLGIAGRKWVVSYDWIVQSFREGRIVDEYDFEVKGDVINGSNHRGPRRSRLGSDGLLLSDFEICCLGSFKDMTRENLEWMVSLCGASLVKEPQMFKHKEGTTSLVVMQPDGKSDYTDMRKRYRALVVTREWVLDSVSSYKLQTFDNYIV